MAIPPWLISMGVRFVFKKFRQRTKQKALTFAKGKLTYASIAGLLLPIVSGWVGFDILPEDLLPVYEGALALLAVWGKYRASRGYDKPAE
jgi:hypothetical protein